MIGCVNYEKKKCNNRNNIADEYRLCGSKYNFNNKWNNRYIRKSSLFSDYENLTIKSWSSR